MNLLKINMNKERRYILIGGAILLLLGVIYRFGPGVYDFFSNSDEISFKKRSVEKYLKIAGRRKSLDKERAYLNRMLKRAESRLLTGKTPSLAAVEVQNILNEISGLNGIKINTMQVLKSKEATDADYITIPVRFSINSNILQLKEMIYGIESSSKLLIITGLSTDTGTRRGVPQGIRSTITVEGVMKAPPAKG